MYVGSLQQQLLQGPVGIGVGVVYGFVFGIGVCKVLPSEKSVINNVEYVIHIFIYSFKLSFLV